VQQKEQTRNSATAKKCSFNIALSYGAKGLGI